MSRIVKTIVIVKMMMNHQMTMRTTLENMIESSSTIIILKKQLKWRSKEYRKKGKGKHKELKDNKGAKNREVY